MYGYYIFLGRGDWGTSRDRSWDPTFRGNVATTLRGDWGQHRQGTDVSEATQWTTAWSRETWIEKVDYLVDELGADTLSFALKSLTRSIGSMCLPIGAPAPNRRNGVMVWSSVSRLNIGVPSVVVLQTGSSTSAPIESDSIPFILGRLRE